MELHITSELTGRKVALIKIGENGKACKEKVVGYEWGTPASGTTYVLYLGKGKFLKTTPIKELKETHNALMFRTANSLYRIEYLKR